MFRSRSGKTVARCLLVGALVLLIPVIAGCEAGYNSPTLEFHPAAGGATGTADQISVNNFFVLGAPVGSTLPAGSSASVFLSLFNNGTTDDALVSMSAPGYASSVQLSGGTVSLPASSPINLMGPQPTVVLSGLTKPLTSGTDIPMILDFAHSGQLKITVPVQPQSFYYSTLSPAPSPSPSPTATLTPTSTPTPTSTLAPTSTPTKTKIKSRAGKPSASHTP